jgi:shikimate kinase
MTPLRPVVVELVGPPGAGKSTLARLLAERDHRIRAGLGVDAVSAPALFASAVRTLPTLLGLCRSAPGLPWAESRQIIRLHALGASLAHGATNGSNVLLLEEGPVLVLSWLHVFCPSTQSDPVLARWRERALARWAAVVRLVLVLDAADDVLRERIRARAKPHLVKHKADRDIEEFIASFRVAFAQVGAALARRGTSLATVRTDEAPLARVAERVLAMLHRETAQC